MGNKNKRKKFEEFSSLPFAFEPHRDVLQADKFAMKGRWKSFFPQEAPIVLELGCGGGEYTLALSEREPHKNYIAVDIKGNRMWKGAMKAQQENRTNVAFLRIQIEHLWACFSSNEVAEIWITFPDPQMKYRRRKKRLTHPAYLDMYREILISESKLHLKTDSAFLFGYTQGVLEQKGWSIEQIFHDIHLTRQRNILTEVETYYEQLFSKQGHKITYICASPPAKKR